MWFHSHSNCPLCRTPVQLDNPVPPSAQSVEEMVSVTEPAGSVTAGEEGETGCSSSTLPPLELVDVLVDMPKVDSGGLDDMGLDAPEETGFKSSDVDAKMGSEGCQCSKLKLGIVLSAIVDLAACAISIL
ncbi:RING-H2 finger protein ATL5-like [Pistacia vera]|uniref:RING-H2 finger protein ATL5-like n=1 Tax=Pistacia vera TaxID=55513 RepID=UPI001263E1BE|nr:RING-H2 finger protein ATL5-like [Pistacia vera]